GGPPERGSDHHAELGLSDSPPDLRRLPLRPRRGVSVSQAPITIAIHTFGRNARDALIADLREGLSRSPKSIPPRWFYDERGSELFDAITRLPEYYQTRTEAEILERVAGEVIAATRPETLVELGAGFCTKSRVLI